MQVVKNIYLNPNIKKPNIIEEIKEKFSLFFYNIPNVNVNVDSSIHDKCFWTISAYLI
jgi:hypothetical protein